MERFYGYSQDHSPQETPVGVKLKGRWKIVLEGEAGKRIVEGNNVICTNGKEFLASLLYSAAVTASTNTMKYLAIGTNATGENSTDTALGTEVARSTGIVSYVSNQIYRVTATFPSGTGTGAIAEYGIFSSSSAGTLLNRDTEAVINKGANDTLTVTCDLTLS